MFKAALISAQPIVSDKRARYFLITNPALLKTLSGEALVAYIDKISQATRARTLHPALPLVLYFLQNSS